jgi:hypothetical protein
MDRIAAPSNGSGPFASVVVAAWAGEKATRRCLESLEPQWADAEVVLATNAGDDAVARLSARFPRARVVRGGSGSDVFVLRALGAAAARGRLVAVTEDHVTFGPTWLEALRAAHAAGHGVLGGPVENGNRSSAYDWALFFAEYGVHVPPVVEGPVVAVSGLNVAYDRELLRGCADAWRRTLEEGRVNDALRARGHEPWMVPRALVVSHLPFTPRQAMGHLLAGGRQYGSYRVSRCGAASRLLLLAPSPLVLVVLLVRIVRRVAARDRRLLPPLVRSLPWLIVLLLAWTAGEATGYATGPGRA